jgi:hypothetical protein
MPNNEKLKQELYNLSPQGRIFFVVLISAALILDNFYSTLILGGVVGALIYPMLEYFLRVVSE